MNTEEYANEVLGKLYSQARAQFGSVIKYYWFNNSDRCPGCGGKLDAVKFKGQDALSISAFIYRERGVLVGYMLCSRCTRRVFRAAKRNPGKQTSIHTAIEKNLIDAYNRHLASMDA